MLRIILKNPDRNTPTRELLNETKELSVHPLGAFQTLQTVFKTGTKEEPKYMFQRMQLRTPEENQENLSSQNAKYYTGGL